MRQLDYAPQIEVTITDHQRRLLSGTTDLLGAAGPASDARLATSRNIGGWQRISLRQDGQRPFIFDGAPLFRASSSITTESGEAKQSIALFSTRSGAFVAEIMAVPPADLAAKPVFRCAVVRTAAAFADFLASYRPEQCFDVSAGTTAQESTHQTQVISVMHDDLQQMVATCLTRPQH